MKHKLAIGIDLGGTNIKGILMQEDGKILSQLKKPVNSQIIEADRSGQHWKEAVLLLKLELEKSNAVHAIGMSAPGIPETKNEYIAYMPGRLHGIEGFHWGNYFERKGVRVLNDAQAALLAEATYGAGKGFENIVMITIGTGVGGGIMINGKIHQGLANRAGHLGHISLDSSGVPGITGIPGSLEDAIGNSTVERRSSGKFKTTAQLVEAYLDGDVQATKIWTESIRKLAIGIASLLNVLSPELVIIGGGIAMAGKALFQPLHQFLSTYEWCPGEVRTPVVQAELNEFSGAIGAAIFALSKNK